jgi:hypothetical protein
MAAWFLVPMLHYLPTVWAVDRRFMWATPEFADGNRLTVDLLIGRVLAPNGLYLGEGALLMVLPLLALVCWRRAPEEGALDPRVTRLAFGLTLTWVALIAFMIAPLPALLVLPAPFAYIQFPWRLLGLTGFLASTAVAILAAGLAPSGRRAWIALGLGILIVATAPRVIPRVQVHPPWRSPDVIAIGLGPYGERGYTILGEYLPRPWTPDSIYARVKRGPAGTPGVRVRSWRSDGDAWVAEIDGERAGEAILPLVYYDFYRVVDSKGQLLAPHTSGGVMALRLDAGRHVLRIHRVRTPVEVAGLALSAAAGIVFLLLRRVPLAFRGPLPQIDDGRPR